MVPTDQIDTALPLSTFGIRSAMVPEPMVIVATPANPERNRSVRNVLSLGETAHNMVKTRNRTFVTL